MVGYDIRLLLRVCNDVLQYLDGECGLTSNYELVLKRKGDLSFSSIYRSP